MPRPRRTARVRIARSASASQTRSSSGANARASWPAPGEADDRIGIAIHAPEGAEDRDRIGRGLGLALEDGAVVLATSRHPVETLEEPPRLVADFVLGVLGGAEEACPPPGDIGRDRARAGRAERAAAAACGGSGRDRAHAVAAASARPRNFSQTPSSELDLAVVGPAPGQLREARPGRGESPRAEVLARRSSSSRNCRASIARTPTQAASPAASDEAHATISSRRRILVPLRGSLPQCRRKERGPAGSRTPPDHRHSSSNRGRDRSCSRAAPAGSVRVGADDSPLARVPELHPRQRADRALDEPALPSVISTLHAARMVALGVGEQRVIRAATAAAGREQAFHGAPVGRDDRVEQGHADGAPAPAIAVVHHGDVWPPLAL